MDEKVHSPHRRLLTSGKYKTTIILRIDQRPDHLLVLECLKPDQNPLDLIECEFIAGVVIKPSSCAAIRVRRSAAPSQSYRRFPDSPCPGRLERAIARIQGQPQCKLNSATGSVQSPDGDEHIFHIACGINDGGRFITAMHHAVTAARIAAAVAVFSPLGCFEQFLE